MAGGRRRLCWGDSGVRRRRRRRSRRQLRCRSGRRSHRRWTEGGRWQRDGWAERVVGKEARPRVLDERRPVERLNGIAAAAAAAALGSTTFAPPAASATTALTALAAATLATAAALATAGHVHPIGAVRLNRLHHWRRRQVRRPRGKGRRRSSPRRHGRALLHGGVGPCAMGRKTREVCAEAKNTEECPLEVPPSRGHHVAHRGGATNREGGCTTRRR